MEISIPPIVDGQFVIDMETDPRPGGMGDVYKATHRQTDSPVALKILKEDRMPEISSESWLREVKSLQQLKGCENIVEIIDVGRCKETGRKYIALEWVQRTLKEFIGDANYGWDDYYQEIGRPILNGLAFAFKNRIYHRDVKPANIMVTDDDIIKVVDFGIAQFAEHFGGQHTLLLRGSRPFAPPWLDHRGSQQKRDVYGFAVLSLCVVNLQLVPNSDVDIQKEMLGLKAPPDVCDFLAQCVSIQPNEVPENINDVLTTLEATQREREKKGKPAAEFFVSVTLNAVNKAPPDLQSESPPKTRQKILADLNRGCVFSYWDEEAVFDRNKKSEIQFTVCTDDYVYDLRPSNRTNGVLDVVSVYEIPPHALEELREQSWAPSVNVRFLEIDDRAREIATGKITIVSLHRRLSEHRAEKQKVEREQAKYRSIQIWQDRVRLQREQQRKLIKGLSYKKIRRESDSRAVFKLDNSVAEDVYDTLYEQPFSVMVDSRFHDSGILESIEGDEATLYFSHTDISSLPQSGELMLSRSLHEVSLNRQDDALTKVRDGVLPKREMTQALLVPETCLPPKTVEVPSWIQGDIDDDKKRAVQCVLGASDISVIEGPPGTGKTKLIAEIILQYLIQNPNSKILLASQTHIALDHALEKVSEVVSSNDVGGISALHMVRLGDSGNAKISKSSYPYLIGPAIEKWRDQAKSESQKFLERWGELHDIDKRNIELGIAIQGYSVLRSRLRSLEEERSQIRDQNNELKEKESQAFVDAENSMVIDDIKQKIETYENDLKRLKKLVSDTKKELTSAKKNLEQLPEGKDYLLFETRDLDEWVEEILPGDEQSTKFRNLYDIQQEWFARFQDTDDFTQIYFDRCELVAGTCVGIAKRELQDIEFDLCIVDEASKATPGEAAVPLAKSKQWVLVGDPRQLPPYVMVDHDLSSMLQNYDGLEEYHLKESLLDYLLSKLPPSNCFRLSKQYRMIRPIGDLVSSIFYEGELESVQTESQVDLTDVFKKPVTWFSTSSLAHRRETKSNTSYANLVEANIIQGLITTLLESLVEQGVQKFTICLLSGYLAQVTELNRMLGNLTIPKTISITACTVDTFQGREADVAIYSITRSNDRSDIGFVRDKARLNVALSRARFALGIVGDANFCNQLKDDLLFPKLWQYVQDSDDCAIEHAETVDTVSRTNKGTKPSAQATHRSLSGLAKLWNTDKGNKE